MQRRLVLTYALLISMLLLGLGIPLALSFTMNDYHHLAIARINDTARLAVQAVPVLRHEQPPDALVAAMRQYDQRTGAAVILVDCNAMPIVTSRPTVELSKGFWRRRLLQACAGVRSDGLDYPYNVRAEPLFIAEPVESGQSVLGAVATISPTQDLRSRAVVRSGLLAAAMILGVAVGVFASMVLARWIMRPVALVDRAAVAVTSGRYDVRAPQETGPPELRRLARAFNTMADRLISLLRAQRTFVADASHQLRNPLTALRLRVEGLEPYLMDRGRPALEATVTEVRRLASILEALLSLAGAQARSAKAGRVDLRAVADGRVAAWQAVAAQRGILIALSGPAAAVSCPPDIVDQVLDVLLDNAVGIAPADSTVRVWTAPGRDTVELHVADEGPGMTPEDKARACDRFWRGYGADDRDGTGLGLAIASTLLDTAGGTLVFDDGRPRGLDVVVRLPVWRPTRESDEPVRPAAAALAERTDS